MTHQRIVIQVHLAINGDDLIVGSFEKRVYFDHRTIKTYICIVKIGDKTSAILECLAAKAEIKSDLSCLESLQTAGRMNPFFKYFFGRFVRNVFNVHSALGAVHDDVLALAAIE